MMDYIYWKHLFENHKYPCYVKERDSGKIIFANEEFYKAFNCGQEIIGKFFYEAITIDGVNYEDIKNSTKLQKHYEFDFWHRKTNQNFYASATVMPNEKTIFCEYRVVLNHKNEESYEKAIKYCTEIYQQPKDTIIPSFLKLLSEYYNCDRTYIYSFDYDNKKINCLNEWSNDLEYKNYDKVLLNTDFDFFIKWIEKNNQDGISMVDIENNDKENVEVLDKLTKIFKIENVTVSAILDNSNKIIGLVGLSNRKNFYELFDSRLIKAISRFVDQDVLNKVQAETLFKIGYTDFLTGLYNRAGYTKCTEEIIGNSPKNLGVVSININGLRIINSNEGNKAGDEHIKKSVDLFNTYFDFDFFRLSGDEFVGICPNISNKEFEEKIISLYNKMKIEKNYDFAIGHAWAEGNFTLMQLLYEAETLMLINKQNYYVDAKRHFNSIDNSVLSELLESLENNEFMIYLQPQIRLKDNSLYGAEALIRRFDKKNNKMIYPDQFIAMYEKKSIIRHIDMFVVEEVCKLIKEFEENEKAIPISVNLSRVTLQEYGIVETIVKICDKYKIKRKLLVIEVTERVGLIENNVASTLIEQFKEQGFHISLDDFGSAYSNIVTLAQIEVDEVKIDKSLVDFLTSNKKNHILVKNVLAMCKELENTSTLSEGIENANQAKSLYELGCDLGQGYFYSKPIPTNEFAKKYLY